MNKEQKQSLKVHIGGKIKISSLVKINTKEDLSLVYTPGVADPCLEIYKDESLSYTYTSRKHMVLVVTDGTAVLGLGDIGPLAAMPVMEGKCLLFKRFASLDAFPLCLDTKDPEEFIKTVKYLSLSFGAINLEDISSPRCVTIERRLIEELDIPVFHDDQHGTAIVVGAGMINAAKVVKKEMKDMRVVISGLGAAGVQVARMLKNLGVKEINGFDKTGVIDIKKYDSYPFTIQELLDEGIISTFKNHDNSLKSIIKGADAFVGVSAPNIVSIEMVQSMNTSSIVFALANPSPEITYEDAVKAGAKVIATGRSDYPNQVNNVLAFPGIFKGALESGAKKITENMKISAAKAIASLIKDEELNANYIIPSAFDKRVVKVVSKAVSKEIKNKMEEKW